MSEIALLTAVRNTIRALSNFDDNEVEIEPDDKPPQNVGKVFVAVMPGAITAGNHHTAGGVIDKMYAVDVAVTMRVPPTPYDRRRNVFIDNTEGMQVYTGVIELAIDFVYQVITDANTIIAGGGGGGFIHPLLFEGYTPLAIVGAEEFQARSGEAIAGLRRTIQFRNARRMQTRS